MDNSIINLTKSVIDRMLNEETIDGHEVTAIHISADNLKIYTGEGVTEPNLIGTIAEGSNIIDILALDEFIEGYPRLRLKRSEDGTPEEYVIAVLVRSGEGTTIEKKRYYVRESMDSAKDPRPMREKLAYLQTPSLLDYTILELHTNGYREGMYVKSTKQVYGYDQATNTYINLGTQSDEAMKGGYNRELEFRSLGYEAREKQWDAEIIFVRCAAVDEVKLEPKLKGILENKRTGIVILDSLIASDLVNSDFIDLASTKAILFTGIEFPHNKPNLLLTSLDGNRKTGMVAQIKNQGYNIIIDDDDKLTLSEIITLGQSTLVVVSKKVGDIQTLFNSIEQEEPKLYRQFIDTLLYMGSLEKRTGVVLTATNRYLLKEKDFYSFGEALDTTKAIQLLLGMLIKPDLCELTIREGSVKVTGIDDRERVLSTVTVSDKQITNFLWEIANPEEQKIMIQQLDGVGNFSTIHEIDTDNGVGLIKVVVFKSEMGLNLQAARLVEPTKDTQCETLGKEGAVTVFVGKRGSGKTSHLKKLALDKHKGKSILVIDEDFDFDHKEFKYARRVNIFRSPESVKVALIKTLNPDMVVINTNISKDYLIDIFESVDPKSNIFMASTYDIIHDMSLGTEGSYREKDIGDMICDNATVIRLSDTGCVTVHYKDRERDEEKVDKYLGGNIDG